MWIGFTLKVGSSNRIRVINNGATQLQNNYFNTTRCPSLNSSPRRFSKDGICLRTVFFYLKLTIRDSYLLKKVFLLHQYADSLTKWPDFYLRIVFTDLKSANTSICICLTNNLLAHADAKKDAKILPVFAQYGTCGASLPDNLRKSLPWDFSDHHLSWLRLFLHLLFHRGGPSCAAPSWCGARLCGSKSTSLIPILARDFYSYSILRTIVLVPLTPLPPKLLRILVSTMATGAFATLPLPTAWQHPNRAHWHHPHTMGDAAWARFGCSPLGGWELCTTPHSVLLLQIKHPKYGFRQQR